MVTAQSTSIKILRDTGASQSPSSAETRPFSEKTLLEQVSDSGCRMWIC